MPGDKSFSTIDETVLMNFLFEKYKTKQNRVRRSRVTSKHIEPLIPVGKVMFSEFVKDNGDDLKYILDDPLFVE